MNNRKTIILTIFIIIGMIVVPTIYKVYKDHNDHLVLVVEKEFLYYAKMCYYESNCENVITLSDLYDNGYLEEKLADPISKKYYSEDSYINLETSEIKLIS